MCSSESLHISFCFAFSKLLFGYLSLDDVEKEVGVTTTAEEVTQTQRLIQAFHLLLDLRWRPARRTPEHRRKTRVEPPLTHLAEHFSLGANLSQGFWIFSDGLASKMETVFTLLPLLPLKETRQRILMS